MEKIKQLLSDNQPEEAIRLLDLYIHQYPEEDEAWYLRGKAYYKLGNTRLALNNYLQAIELNPQSPAKETYQMAIQILNFYNKDLYNP